MLHHDPEKLSELLRIPRAKKSFLFTFFEQHAGKLLLALLMIALLIGFCR
jgi:hypothetical protein